MWNCHNVYFQDERPVLRGTPRCMCSLARPLTCTQRFMCLDHFSSQTSLTVRTRNRTDVSLHPTIQPSHSLYLFLKKKFKLINRPKIFVKIAHFCKIQLNQKSFDDYSQTILQFSWRSSKGLKHAGFWNESCRLHSFWVIVERTRIINWDSVLRPSATESKKKVV